MDRLPEPMAADMRAFARWIGSASPGSHVVEEPGVVASVVPVVPDRSVFNSVIYDDPAVLADALPRLAAAYDAAGVKAWTVWVPDGDRAAADLLGRAGHVLDAEPAAMICPLGRLEAPDPGDLDWTGEGELADLTAVNDASYPYEDNPFTTALQLLDPSARVFVASHGGRPACALCTIELDGSAGVYWVATIPEARGMGLAARLLGQALLEARARGCTTSTLQATRMGAPVYTRVGFRGEGTLQMWERRRS